MTKASIESDHDLIVYLRDGPYHWIDTIAPIVLGSVFLFVVFFFIWLGFYSMSIGGHWQDALCLSSIGIVLFGSGVFFMLRRIIRFWRKISNLKRDFTITEGEIVGCEVVKEYVTHDAKGNVHYVIVRFQPKTLDTLSEDLVLQGRVNRKIFKSVVVGQSIRIKYANINPKLALFEWEFSSQA